MELSKSHVFESVGVAYFPETADGWISFCRLYSKIQFQRNNVWNALARPTLAIYICLYKWNDNKEQFPRCGFQGDIAMTASTNFFIEMR